MLPTPPALTNNSYIGTAMASIRKHIGKKGTTYNVEIRMKGFPPQRATFKSITKAKAWVQATESAIRDGRHFTTTEARKHTLAELIKEYKEEVTDKNPKARSQKFQLDYWSDEIGHLVLADVTKKAINLKKKELLHLIQKIKQLYVIL